MARIVIFVLLLLIALMRSALNLNILEQFGLVALALYISAQLAAYVPARKP